METIPGHTGSHKGAAYTQANNVSISFTPIRLTNLEKQSKANAKLLITFYLIDETTQDTLRLPIPQGLFMADTVSRVPQLLDEPEGEEMYPFRALLGVGARKNVSADWEAFHCFSKWLESGIYTNKQIAGSHIDAYILSEALQSPRFGNAVMQYILADIRSSKYDVELKNIFRNIFAKCSKESPLRKLYLEASVFWKLEFGGGGRSKPASTYGEGVLGLDPEHDRSLIETLDKHKGEFCKCNVKALCESLQAKTLRNLSGAQVCICQKEPWLVRPERFYRAN